MRKKIILKNIRDKVYKTSCRQLDVPVTTVAHTIQKFKIHGTVATLPGCGDRRKIDYILKRQVIRMESKEPVTTTKQIAINSKVKDDP